MKNFLTRLVTQIGVKQVTIAVALLGTAFLVVQASSAPKYRSTTIDDFPALAHVPVTVTESLPGVVGEAHPNLAASPVAATTARSSRSESNRNPSSLGSQRKDIASDNQLARQASSVTSVGAPVKQSFLSSSVAGINGASAGTAGRAGFGAGSSASGSSAPGSTGAMKSQTDSPASSALKNPVSSTALSNTTDALASSATDGNRSEQNFLNPVVESAVGDEFGANLPASSLELGTEMGESTLDRLGMTISDLEPSGLSTNNGDIASVSSVPDAGSTLWLLSAAMIGLMAYGRRCSFRFNAGL